MERSDVKPAVLSSESEAQAADTLYGTCNSAEGFIVTRDKLEIVDLDRFRGSPIGRLVPIVVEEGDRRWEHEAYVPAGLPDSVQLSQDTWALVAAASGAVARLDGAAHRLPNPYLLVRPALTEEAVSSSALEGTYAALEDVFQAEFLDVSEVSRPTAEVRNYISAAERGLELIKTLPICLRVLRDVHSVLMFGSRGDYAEAGNFRTRQNWIGTRRGQPVSQSLFVPPPAGSELGRGLNEWEAWVNEPNGLPVLLKSALAHYQFETLHPFIDGNGRVGRLVIVLMLVASGELKVPLLNLSPFFEQHRDEYIDHLRTLSETGDFEPWISFFMGAVKNQSERALDKADRLSDLREDMANELYAAGVRGVALRIAEGLVGGPFVTPARAAQEFGVTYPAANSAIARLVETRILREATGRSYARIFAAPRVLEILHE
jgi:Fic family protein